MHTKNKWIPSKGANSKAAPTRHHSWPVPFIALVNNRMEQFTRCQRHLAHCCKCMSRRAARCFKACGKLGMTKIGGRRQGPILRLHSPQQTTIRVFPSIILRTGLVRDRQEMFGKGQAGLRLISGKLLFAQDRDAYNVAVPATSKRPLKNGG